jgi:hypothetical protein
MRTLVESYLKEMGVPAKYADLMFSIPKDHIRFINYDDFQRDFEGYIPELRDWLDAKCNKLTDVEKIASKGIGAKKRRNLGRLARGMAEEKLTVDEERMDQILGEKLMQQGACLAQTLPKLREEAWKQFHGR